MNKRFNPCGIASKGKHYAHGIFDTPEELKEAVLKENTNTALSIIAEKYDVSINTVRGIRTTDKKAKDKLANILEAEELREKLRPLWPAISYTPPTAATYPFIL